jgi:hypothetical protein
MSQLKITLSMTSFTPVNIHSLPYFDFHELSSAEDKYLKVYSNKHPTRRNVTQFILSENFSTCFGWYHHSSSEAQTTVSTASGI